MDDRETHPHRPRPFWMYLSVSVPSLSSHTSTSDSFYPSSFRDRPERGMCCWFNLWPRAAVSATSFLTLLLLCKCSSSVRLHHWELSEDRPWRRTAHPGGGIVHLHHLHRLRRDHLGLPERLRRGAVLPDAGRRRWPELQNRAEQPHNQCFDVMARELEEHGGLSVQRSAH